MCPKKRKEKKGFFSRIGNTVMILLSIVIAFALLLCAKISWISPESLSLFAYPIYALMPLAFLNILLFFYWLFRLKGCLLLPLLAAVLTYSEVESCFVLPFSKEKEMQRGKEIKVLTYNTMQFSQGKSHTSRNPNVVISYLQECAADIVCLQESGGTYGIPRREIVLGMKKYPYYVENKAGNTSNGSSMWLFSKYPIVRKSKIQYDSLFNGSFYCDVKIGEDTLRVINNHMESNRLTTSDKNLYKKIIAKPDKENISYVAQKLGDKIGPAAVVRAAQAEAVAEVIRESPYPVLVCGDFNDIPASYTYRTVSKGLVDAWRENGMGFGTTFHEKFYRFRIDYIFHSPELSSWGTKLDKLDYSDHYPLWTYLQLP